MKVMLVFDAVILLFGIYMVISFTSDEKKRQDQCYGDR